MKKIGITGGIGSGKSEVLRFLNEREDTFILMSDEMGHQQMLPGTEGYAGIVKEFGPQVLSQDQTINRAALSAIVFSDPDRLAALNAIIHPAVRRAILRAMQEEEAKGTGLFILESALLLEGNYKPILDELWYIYTEREERIRRLILSRGYSREKCLAVMGTQLSEESFRQGADRVIDNSGAWENTKEQLQEALAGICSRTKED